MAYKAQMTKVQIKCDVTMNKRWKSKLPGKSEQTSERVSERHSQIDKNWTFPGVKKQQWHVSAQKAVALLTENWERWKKMDSFDCVILCCRLRGKNRWISVGLLINWIFSTLHTIMTKKRGALCCEWSEDMEGTKRTMED
jgi:hypothetical protein